MTVGILLQTIKKKHIMARFDYLSSTNECMGVPKLYSY